MDESVHLSESLSFGMSFSSESSLQTSPVKSKPVSLDQSFSAIQAMFESSDSEVEPFEIEVKDCEIPETNESRISDSSILESEFNENILKLTENDDLPKEINEIVVKYWFKIDKHQQGEPGNILADEILKHKENPYSSQIVNKIFNQLDDIRTSIVAEENLLLFYNSALAFYHKMANNAQFSTMARKLTEKSVESAAKAFGGRIVVMISHILTLDMKTPEYNDVIAKLRELRDKFKEQKELYQNIVNFSDCAITNMIITDKLFNKIDEFIWANTNLTIIEDEIQLPFVHFRQALLAVVANQEILTNSNSLQELVPLIPPNFIYFMFCMQDFINYQQMEAFAQKHNLNFNMKCDDFLLKPQSIVIPE